MSEQQAWTDFAPPHRPELSQYHTPPAEAARLVRWRGLTSLRRVLEPSAGGGSIVRAVLDADGLSTIDAVELDPEWAAFLRSTFPDRVSVIEGDYLARPAPEEPYDLCVMNPPYEGGLDGEFLEKALKESTRVIALLRVVALCGDDRYRRLWSRLGVLGHRLVGIAYYVTRPFVGAKSDFCALKFGRADLEVGPGYCGTGEGWRGGTSVEWWQPGLTDAPPSTEAPMDRSAAGQGGGR